MGNLKRFITFLLCFMLILFELTPVMAAENTGDFLISGTTLFDYNGNESVVTIPDGVTEIMADCFY